VVASNVVLQKKGGIRGDPAFHDDNASMRLSPAKAVLLLLLLARWNAIKF